MSKNVTIEAALNYVYTDFEAYVKACAMEHTIANLGQSLEDCRMGGLPPERLIQAAFNQVAGDYELEGVPIDGELRMWLKMTRPDCEAVRKAGLPLTVANGRKAFMKETPFTAKKKAKK